MRVRICQTMRWCFKDFRVLSAAATIHQKRFYDSYEFMMTMFNETHRLPVSIRHATPVQIEYFSSKQLLVNHLQSDGLPSEQPNVISTVFNGGACTHHFAVYGDTTQNNRPILIASVSCER